jgi:phage FluMu protein Com
MNEHPRRILVQLIRMHGRTIADDGRLKGLLNDALRNEHRKEVNVLVHAVEAKVVSDLLTLTTTIPPSVLIGRLAQKLRDEKGTGETEARWAVETWLLAFELTTVQELAAIPVQVSVVSAATKWTAAPSPFKPSIAAPSNPQTASFSLECTHCGVVLKAANPIPSGKQVKCPKCSGIFLVKGIPDPEDSQSIPSHLHGTLPVPHERTIATPPSKQTSASSALLIACPECGKHLQVPGDLMGEKVQCPECNENFVAEQSQPSSPTRRSSRVPVSRPRPAKQASGRGTMLIMLSVVGFLCVPYILGPIVWILANNDLKAMREGKMDDTDESTTKMARIFGIVDTLFALGIVFVYCWIGCTGAFNQPPGGAPRPPSVPIKQAVGAPAKDVAPENKPLQQFDGRLTKSASEITHQVTMVKGKSYQIDLMSQEFDAYLILQDPNGTKVAENDDGGEGLNSRIVYQPKATGIHRVVATSLGRRGVGAFVLEVREK